MYCTRNKQQLLGLLIEKLQQLDAWKFHTQIMFAIDCDRDWEKLSWFISRSCTDFCSQKCVAL